jgi:plastocyanin
MNRFAGIAVLSLITSVAYAQVSTQLTSTPSTVSSELAATFTVKVGEGGFIFRPDVVIANVGDYVEFDFYPQNHSVVRAECVVSRSKLRPACANTY